MDFFPFSKFFQNAKIGAHLVSLCAEINFFFLLGVLFLPLFFYQKSRRSKRRKERSSFTSSLTSSFFSSTFSSLLSSFTSSLTSSFFSSFTSSTFFSSVFFLNNSLLEHLIIFYFHIYKNQQ